jgi:predicted metal-dependent hydrolase
MNTERFYLERARSRLAFFIRELETANLSPIQRKRFRNMARVWSACILMRELRMLKQEKMDGSA